MTVSMFAPQQTLAYQLSRPLCIKRDLSAVPFNTMAQQMQAVVPKLTKIKVEEEALRFYLLQHAMGCVRAKYAMDEPLPAEALKICHLHHEYGNRIAIRAFYYLISICMGEAHHHNPPPAFWDKMANQFGATVRDFMMQAKGAAKSVLQGGSHHKVTVGGYASAVEFVFFHGKWGGGAYGGSKWGEIAKTMRQFVDGTYSAEMMLDTAFALAHNCAPIFDKGYLYYQNDVDALYTILDVQASGQIPNLFSEPQWFEGKPIVESNRPLFQQVSPIFGPLSAGVDWYLVAADGKGHTDYSTLKQNQKIKSGGALSKSQQIAQKAAQMAAAAKAADTFTITASHQYPKKTRKKPKKEAGLSPTPFSLFNATNDDFDKKVSLLKENLGVISKLLK